MYALTFTQDPSLLETGKKCSSLYLNSNFTFYLVTWSTTSFFRSDYSHRYHDSYRDRPSFHNSDFSRTHERSSDHGRSHDQHSRGYERNSDHSRSYEKRDRRDDYHRGSSRDYLSEGRYHHSHRERNSDSTLRHGNSASSPKSGSTHESKRYEEKRSVEGERDKRWQRVTCITFLVEVCFKHAHVLVSNQMWRRIFPRYIDTVTYFINIFHIFECLIFFIFLSYLISFFHRRVYDNE